MARYKDEQCRICRREGQKLFLKGSRCYSDKCSISRRNYAPGQHGQKREELYPQIMEKAICAKTAQSSPERIEDRKSVV